MLDDGMGFRLVPWKPAIDQRPGPQITAAARGCGVSWQLGQTRARGVSPPIDRPL